MNNFPLQTCQFNTTPEGPTPTPQRASDLSVVFSVAEMEDDSGCLPNDVEHNDRRIMYVPLEYMGLLGGGGGSGMGGDLFEGTSFKFTHPLTIFRFGNVREGRGVRMRVHCFNRHSSFRGMLLWSRDITSKELEAMRKSKFGGASSINGACSNVANNKCNGTVECELDEKDSFAIVKVRLVVAGIEHFFRVCNQ